MMRLDHKYVKPSLLISVIEINEDILNLQQQVYFLCEAETRKTGLTVCSHRSRNIRKHNVCFGL